MTRNHTHTRGGTLTDDTTATAATEPSPQLVESMRAIAASYRGVEYDMHDRPGEVAAVIAAARAVGLVPVPSETITPRTFRGCTPPPPATAPPVIDAGLAQHLDVDAAAEAAGQARLAALAEVLLPALKATWLDGLAVGVAAVTPGEGQQ